MAALNPSVVNDIDWAEATQEVGESGRNSSGMVEIVDKAARIIMKNGAPMEVNRLKNIIEKGLNKDLVEGDEKITVHWATVNHMLTTHDGFRLATDNEGKPIKNTFVFDAGVKKNHGKATRKVTQKGH